MGEESGEFFLDGGLVVPPVEDTPSEFFMIGEAEEISGGGGDPVGPPREPVPNYPEAGVSPRPPATSGADWGSSPTLNYPSAEFNQSPQGTSGSDWGSSPTVMNSTPPGYAGGAADWTTVPSTGVESAGGFRGCIRDAHCACQERWVNWRHGSDYLEGCIPDGYNGFLTIRVTSPSEMYSSPLHTNGPVQVAGSLDAAGPDRDRLNRSITMVTTNIDPDSTRVPRPEVVPDADPAGPDRLPFMHAPGTHRGWNGMAYYWDASHLIHQPLYFEDVNLERQGYSYGIMQPFVSAARFYGRLPLLPYAVAAHPHHEAVYTLGEFRPGSPAPFVCDRPPRSLPAGAFEAAVVTGLFFAIP